MTTLRQRVIALLTAATTALAITACSGGSTPTANGSIDVLSWWTSTSESSALNVLVDRYEKQNPGTSVDEIAVVGGGDAALEEALFLTRFADSVTLIHRRDRLRGSEIMVERAKKNPKIDFAWNSVVVDLHGDDRLESVTLQDTRDGSTRELAVEGLFEAIGSVPRSELFKGQVALDEAGYVLVEGSSTRTDLPGVFACGDLVDHVYRQAISAAGTGCRAALDAENHLAFLQS